MAHCEIEELAAPQEAYLLGIVRNIAERNEAWQITDALLRLRIEAHDSAIADLVSARALILHREATPLDRLHTLVLVARAMSTDLLIERLFWLKSTVDLVRAQPAPDHQGLLRAAARHINTVSRVRYRERLDALRLLVDGVIELDRPRLAHVPHFPIKPNRPLHHAVAIDLHAARPPNVARCQYREHRPAEGPALTERPAQPSGADGASAGSQGSVGRVEHVPHFDASHSPECACGSSPSAEPG